MQNQLRCNNVQLKSSTELLHRNRTHRILAVPVSLSLQLLLLLPVILLASLQQYQSNQNVIALPAFLAAQAMSMPAVTSSPSEVVSSHSLSKADSHYDVVIIGGGSAGLTAAKLIGPTLQKTCCIIELNKMGGDCTWTGCIPSKSFIAASKRHHAKHRNTDSDNDSDSLTTKDTYIPPLADLSDIKAEIQSKIQQIYDADDSPEALQKLGNIDVIYGQATLKSSKLVQVALASATTSQNNDQSKENIAQHAIHATEGIIICTGAEPKLPTIPGLDNYYTYETIWDQLVTIPKQLIIIGGGPIGCEIAQAMSRFGSNVTIITTSSTILPQEDPEVSKLMSNLLTTQYNIHIVYGLVTKVDQESPAAAVSTAAKSYTAHVSVRQQSTTTTTTTVSGGAILVAIGRQPRCIPGFEKVGIQLNEQNTAIKVNTKLQTSNPNIYAAGDCTGDRQFTHYAGYQGAIAARNILLPFTDPGVLPNVPSTIYTSPEISTIGISEKVAIDQYGSKNIVVYQRHLSHVDRAVCDGAQDGLIKIICTKRNNHILGATIVAPVAGEMISEIAVMMKAKMSFDKLATVMHPYPSYAMALQLMAAEVYYEKTVKLKWLLDLLKWFGL